MGKANAFRDHLIQYKGGKILAPTNEWIKPLLKDGNSKVGEKVLTFSLLPTNKSFATKYGELEGTCTCTCKECYATKGFYNMPSVFEALARTTYLAQYFPHWTQCAIEAQLEAVGPCEVRIHASGDFFSDEYAEMWHTIAKEFPECKFWTYTKVVKYEHLFDDLPNANIVKSVIPGIGYNYGHCDYILDAFEQLKARGEDVHICRCGIDKNQHCENCKGCIEHKFVLFLEHSTSYRAEADPMFNTVKEVIEAQGV